MSVFHSYCAFIG